MSINRLFLQLLKFYDLGLRVLIAKNSLELSKSASYTNTAAILGKIGAKITAHPTPAIASQTSSIDSQCQPYRQISQTNGPVHEQWPQILLRLNHHILCLDHARVEAIDRKLRLELHLHKYQNCQAILFVLISDEAN